MDRACRLGGDEEGTRLGVGGDSLGCQDAYSVFCIKPIDLYSVSIGSSIPCRFSRENTSPQIAAFETMPISQSIPEPLSTCQGSLTEATRGCTSVRYR
jgi:hypothetical protein